MQQIQTSSLEKYILGDMSEIEKIAKYDENNQFLLLLNKLKHVKTKDDQLKEEIMNFLKNEKVNPDLQKIIGEIGMVKDFLLSDEENQKKQLDQINETFYKFNFDFEKGFNARQMDDFSDSKQTHTQSLNEEELKILSLNEFIERIYNEKNPDLLDQLKEPFINRIDLTRFDYLKDWKLCFKIINKNTIEKAYMMKGFMKFLYFLAETQKNENKVQNYINDFMYNPNIPINILEEMLLQGCFKNNKRLLVIYFQQKFSHLLLKDKVTLNLKDYYEGLDFIHAKDIKMEIGIKYEQFLTKLLYLTSEQNNYDLKLWEEYLNFKKIQRNPYKTIEQLQSFVNIALPPLHPNGLKNYVFYIIREHLKKNHKSQIKDSGEMTMPPYDQIELFKDKELDLLIDMNYYIQEFYQNQLVKGNQQQEVLNFFTKDEIQKFVNQKKLRILTDMQFVKPEDKVQIKLQIKNIQQITVDIYEISLLKYLKNNSSINFLTLDLTGLKPTHQQIHHFSESSLEIFEKTISFPEIDSQQRGVFIVDFKGEDLHSRAQISKGNLSYIYEDSKDSLVILDEQMKVLKNTSVFLKELNTYIKSDQNGLIEIKPNQTISEVILIHENYAQFYNIQITQKQDYNLSLALFLNPESIQQKKVIKFFIRLLLSCNNKLISINELKDTILYVYVKNKDSVTKTFKFQDLELKDNEDYPVEVVLPSFVSQIEVRLEGSIKDAKSHFLTAQQSVNLRDQQHGTTSNFYLFKNDLKEYIVQYIGLNGEFLQDQIVKVGIQPIFTNYVEFTKKTDNMGRINLGTLKECESIILNINDQEREQFMIHQYQQKDLIHMSRSLSVFEGETIKLPNRGQDNWCLYSINKGKKVDKSDLLKLSDYIEIMPLQKGEYKLINTNTFESILIKVFKALKLEIPGYFRVKNTIQQKKEYKYMAYTVQETETDKVVTLDQKGFNKIDAFLINSNYLTDIDNFIQFCGHSQLQTKIKADRNQNAKSFQINKIPCNYSNEKSINFELLYCQERKNKGKFLSNNLEKPSLFIKKFRDKPAYDQNILKQVDPYGNQFADCMQTQNYCAPRACSLHKVMKGRKQNVRPMENEFRDLAHLKSPGIIQKVEVVDNKITIQKDQIENFNNSLLVILADDKSKIIELSTQDKEVPLVDVRLANSITKNFINHNKYESTYLKAEQTKKYNNFKNTDMLIVGDCENLAAILGLLLGNQEFQEESKMYWNWFNFSTSEKLHYFNEYYCNELNLFIYIKDRDFFTTYAKNIIQDKIEKTLLDYYLLEEYAEVEKYYQLINISTLSKLELILLFSIAKKNQPEFAQKIKTYFKNNSKRICLSEKLQETLLDSILNCQNENIDQDKLNQAKHELQRIYNVLNRNQDVGFCDEEKVQENLYYNCNRLELSCEYIPQAQCDEECEEESSFSYQRRAPQKILLGYGQPEAYQRQRIGQQQKEKEEKSMGLTYSYKETQYKYKHSSASVVEQFWSDLLDFVDQQNSFEGFFSSNFMYNSLQISSCIATLIFTDLPHKYKDCKNDINENTLQLTAMTNCFILSKELIQERGEKITGSVSLIQRFFDPQDETFYDEETNEFYDKNLSEFLKQKIYTSKIILTNFSQKEISLKLMYQIPQGSLPIGNHKKTSIQNITLNSFETKSIQFNFYFPQEGEFQIYPATLFKEKKILALAEIPNEIEVMSKQQIQEAFTLNDVLSGGSIDEILSFIKSKNILNQNTFNLRDTYWLLKNKKFYTEIIKILQEQGIFVTEIWAFSIFHQDISTFMELFNHSDISDDQWYVKYFIHGKFNEEITEFHPLQNSRTHSLKERQTNIINKYFQDHYVKFLTRMAVQEEMNNDQKLLLVEYLLCQERIQESLALFNTIKEEEIIGKIQYNYVNVYLKFLRGSQHFEEIKDICDQYVEYPLLEWRNLFIEVINLISEYEELELIQQDINLTKQKNKVDLEVTDFKAELQEDIIQLTFSKSEEIKIDFYEIDLEVLFSIDPFTKVSSIQNFYVTPTHSITQALENPHLQRKSLQVNLGEFKQKNCIIEVKRQNGDTTTFRHTPFNFVYLLNTEKGQIKVFDPVKQIPLSNVYVKTFAKNNDDKVMFFRDGYTDIRGQFDYAFLNVEQNQSIQKFSILVITQENGSKIIDCDPPKTFVKPKVEKLQIRSQNYQKRLMKK